MPTQPPIPPLLKPYLSTPRSSLTLLTSTLGASTNWLLLRFIHAASKSQASPAHEDEGKHAATLTIVLVSWLRDAAFWKEGAKKLGIDLQRIHIVDGLSTNLGLSSSSGIPAVESTILEAIKPAPNADGSETLLVLDGLDFFLAATAVPVTAVFDMVLELREHVRCAIITAAADGPLVQSPATPLEVSHAALVTGMAHQASLVMSVRELDTGVAKDVSGVLRITKGVGNWDEDGIGEEGEEVMESRECLYFVGGDGGVRVFERGA